ncbi:MAG: T9SS type A sorting domain-containing protein [Paludibacter sp.]|nr:T9SS type A sorting domain-containing protein [Paludibacter sp.]
MKQKLPFAGAVIVLLALGLTTLQSQSLYVKPLSGTQTAYTLTNLKKLTFTSGNLVVTKMSGNPDSYVLSALRYVNFKDYSVGLNNVTNMPLSILYPNPVANELNIKIASDRHSRISIEILSLEGKILFSKVPDENSTVYQVNVSGINKGLYLCRINDGSTIETIKFIKQ